MAEIALDYPERFECYLNNIFNIDGVDDYGDAIEFSIQLASFLINERKEGSRIIVVDKNNIEQELLL